MKILFASMPFDGHYQPLSALAAHLVGRGHDVRFYTGPGYAARLAALGIAHVPFTRARDVHADDLVQHFPEYERLGVGPKAIEFALTEIFFGNTAAHLSDIEELRTSFPFERLVCDGAFYAAYLVAKKCGVPTYAVAPAPTPAPTSPSAPPPFFGLKPATNWLARARERVVRRMIGGSTRRGMALFRELLAGEGLPPYEGSPFDLLVDAARAVFQVGVPGMDYPRADWPTNLHFVGALVPPGPRGASNALEPALRARYPKLVVVTQGTVDNRDPEKLLVPALEALRGGPHLVVACTGGRHTAELRTRFAAANVVIEDYVPFDQLFEQTNVFVTNGGYGGVLHALRRGVPVLAAGKLEGKNDVNARLAYRGLGIDLRTERPRAARIRRGVARLLSEPHFAANAAAVSRELAAYDPLALMEEHIVGRSEAARRAS